MKYKLVNKALLMLFFILFLVGKSQAQCAMCRATIETNMSTGKATFGSGVNLGIVYLLVMPYMAIGLLAYFWYKSSRKSNEQLKIKGYIQRKVSTL